MTKGFTPTASTSTASGAQYVQDYGDDPANIPMTPEQIYAAAAEASTQAGSIFTPQGPMANAMNSCTLCLTWQSKLVTTYIVQTVMTSYYFSYPSSTQQRRARVS